jgi:ribosomal protein S27E
MVPPIFKNLPMRKTMNDQDFNHGQRGSEFIVEQSSTSMVDNNKIRCDICGKFFLRTSLLQHKYQKHPQNNKVECDVCGKQIFKFQLQAHKVQAHKIKPQCKICGKELHPGSLKRHMVN